MKAGRILHIILIALVVVILTSHSLLNNKKVQEAAAVYVEHIGTAVLGTELSAGSVQFVFPFGIKADDITLYDLAGDTLAHVASLSLRLKPMQLLRNKISITSVRVNVPTLYLNRDSIGHTANYDFLLSSLSGSNSLASLRANSIVVRNGAVSYDVKSEPQTDSLFNSNHIGIKGLTAHISIKSVTADSVSLIVRRFSLKEQSGFELTRSRGALTVGKGYAHVMGLRLNTPESSLEVSELTAYPNNGQWALGNIGYKADLKASITGADFKAFLPQASTMTDCIDLVVSCSGSGRETRINSLTLHDHNGIFSMNGVGTLIPGRASLLEWPLSATVNATFDRSMPQWIENQAGGFGLHLPNQLYKLGNGTLKLTMNQNADNLSSNVELECQSGRLVGSVAGQRDKYSGKFQGTAIRLGTITGNKELGRCDFTLKALAAKQGDSYSCTFDSKVSRLDYRQYIYRDITANGQIAPGMVLSSIQFADSNGALDLEASMTTNGVRSMRMDLTAQELNLPAYNLVNRDSLILSTQFHADLSGTDIDHLYGKMTLDSLLYADAGGEYFMENMTATVGSMNERSRVISLFSDFISMSVVGDFHLSSLPYSLARAGGDVMPTIGSMVMSKLGVTNNKRPNMFVVEGRLTNTELLEKVFHAPVHGQDPTTVRFSFNDVDSIYSGQISIPSLQIALTSSLSQFLWVMNSKDGSCKSQMTGSYSSQGKEPVEIDGSFLVFDDIIRGKYSWENHTGDVSGEAKSISQFLTYNKKEGLKSLTLVDSTNLLINGVPWKTDIARIETDRQKVTLTGLKVYNKEQHLLLDGVVSDDSTEILNLSLQNIDLDHTLSMFHLNNLAFKGTASGNIQFAGVMGRPSFTGSFSVREFGFMDSYHGNMEARCFWDDSQKRIMVLSQMDDPGVSSTVLSCYYTPLTKDIEINIGADRTDLHFLNTWTKNVFRELDGRAIGNLRLFGTLPQIDMEGSAILVDGLFDEAATNTQYYVKRDTLWFEPGRMLFTNVEFYDGADHDGILNCILTHDHFNNWEVNMGADVTNMLVYNQSKTDNNNSYAQIYAEGSMTLKVTPSKGVEITVDARTAPGTRLGLESGAGSVANYNFLTIVDRDLGLTTQKIDANNHYKRKANGDYSLDMNIECTEDALLELDENTLRGLFRGNGNINLKLTPKDGPLISGIYNLSLGQCTLSIEDLIQKNFQLLDGSYVRFNGSPDQTELNLLTYHNVNSVSMYALDPTSSQKVRVRCLMDITGNVLNPQLSFNIDIPNGTSDERSILSGATATEEQKNIQFMYLMTIGSFYTFDPNSDSNLLSQNTMSSFVNSTVSSQIDNLIQQVVHSEKVTISSNLSATSYLTNDATNLNNKELEGILEARLLNNRLLVNGNFGYRENVVNNTTNLIGDFEVKYLLIPDRKGKGVSIKGYNKANDKYFSKTTLTTQGVGLVIEKDF